MTRLLVISSIVAALCVARPAPAETGGGGADERPYYFYRALPYGSESLVHPLRTIINGGFGITSFDNRDNRLHETDYATGWKNLWKNLLDPVGSIQAEGWGDFFEREVEPSACASPF